MYKVITQNSNGNKSDDIFSSEKMIQAREEAIAFIRRSMEDGKSITRIDLHFCIHGEKYGPCIWAIKKENDVFQEDKTQENLNLKNLVKEYEHYENNGMLAYGFCGITLKGGGGKKYCVFQHFSY